MEEFFKVPFNDFTEKQMEQVWCPAPTEPKAMAQSQKEVYPKGLLASLAFPSAVGKMQSFTSFGHSHLLGRTSNIPQPRMCLSGRACAWHVWQPWVQFPTTSKRKRKEETFLAFHSKCGSLFDH